MYLAVWYFILRKNYFWQDNFLHKYRSWFVQLKILWILLITHFPQEKVIVCQDGFPLQKEVL